jgi:hypothetical protein
MQPAKFYRTTELEVASFLKARGHRLLGAMPAGRLIEFSFDTAAAPDVDAYITGAPIPARELFEAHRSLRALIQQVKEHYQNRSETNKWNNNSSSNQHY